MLDVRNAEKDLDQEKKGGRVASISAGIMEMNTSIHTISATGAESTR